jgi:hypothetical protein
VWWAPNGPTRKPVDPFDKVFGLRLEPSLYISRGTDDSIYCAGGYCLDEKLGIYGSILDMSLKPYLFYSFNKVSLGAGFGFGLLRWNENHDDQYKITFLNINATTFGVEPCIYLRFLGEKRLNMAMEAGYRIGKTNKIEREDKIVERTFSFNGIRLGLLFMVWIIRDK